MKSREISLNREQRFLESFETLADNWVEKSVRLWLNKRGSQREPIPVTHDNFLNLFLYFAPRYKVIFKSHSHGCAASDLCFSKSKF